MITTQASSLKPQAYYKIIGLMSGTSLDGVDIAYCEFYFSGKWTFRLLKSETILYDENWKSILGSIHLSTAIKITEIDSLFGSFLGVLVRDFCSRHKISPEFISSHGHTVFHQPQNGYTKQIGSGAFIAAASGFPVICDFRSMDVAIGGQGAPLVPIGDKHLFSEADYCLNLGGIANISYENNELRTAFDICACNLVLNHYAQIKGKLFDENGILAADGKINNSLLEALNKLDYYSKPFPKTLGREDVERDIFPLINSYQLKVEDVLATFCEHIARKIAASIKTDNRKNKLLITGGGVYNTFLLNKISIHCESEIVIPAKEIIEFKEAIIFGFLGVLRMRNEINCLKSVTGASRDSCGGAIYLNINQLIG